MMLSKEISASSDGAQWQSIDWKSAEAHVLKLQMRIAKATREKKCIGLFVCTLFFFCY